MVTIHCSDTENGHFINLKALEKDHIDKGFGGIAYHAIIQPDGEVIQTRPLNQKGSHVKNHNSHNVGICLPGTDKFTRAQFAALWGYLNTLRLAFSIKPQDLICHYEFDTARAQSKTCPNIRAVDLVVWYLTQDESVIDKYLIEA